MATRRRWSEHEVEQLRSAVSTHGHCVKSVRSIFADAAYPLLKSPTINLQQLEDKIKSLKKQKASWLASSAPGSPHGVVAEPSPVTPMKESSGRGSSTSSAQKRQLAEDRCTPEKEPAVQVKKAKKEKPRDSSAGLVAPRPLDAISWALVLQRLYRLLLPALKAWGVCLNTPEGWCSSHEILEVHPLWLMQVGRAINRIKRIFAWALPSQAALDTIKKFSPKGVVEMGAGSGYWASLLCQEGIQVVAYDDFSWGLEMNVSQDDDNAGLPSKIPLHFPVTAGGPSELRRHSMQSLLLVMPPCEQEENDEKDAKGEKKKKQSNYMAYEALLAFAGDTLFLVGERITKDAVASPRTTAGVTFCKHLVEHWNPVQTVALPVWPGTGSVPIELHVWQRKAPNISMRPLLDVDTVCDKQHAVDPASHRDRARLVMFFIGEFIDRMREAARGPRFLDFKLPGDVKARSIAKELVELRKDLKQQMEANTR